jgi:hypothetical protein
MTVTERNEYIHIVKSAIDEVSAKLGESCIYDFHGDDIDALRSPRDAEPDFIPGSMQTVALQQKMVRVVNIFAVVCDPSNQRIYPWGTLRIDDAEHSDFSRLQSVLFESGEFLLNRPK